MSGYLVAADGAHADADRHTIARMLSAGELLWLDLLLPDQGELAMLGEVFEIHPLALRDMASFGQRPKLADYDSFTHLVAYGALDGGEPMVEVHCLYSDRYLVTVRRVDSPAIAGVRELIGRRAKPPTRLQLLHYLLDALVDSFFPVLSAFDDRIDELQDEIFAKPTDAQLSELFTMKRWLIGVRKVVTPQRDLAAGLVAGLTELPGMTPEVERYFRDLYDHLIRISDLVDSYRDLLTGSMDAYLSTVSNRLNTVMKQLTVIATIFLPLTFLTGFFGQNFAWLVRHITGLAAFVWVGLGIEALVIAGMLVLFRRRGWV